MITKHHTCHPIRTTQNGVVLVVTLIMLALLTMIGITAMNVTNLEEKMAGNAKDKNIAFQAAEAALRDAENDIENSGRVSGITGMDASCTNGLCYRDNVGIPHIETDAAKVANAVDYGTYSAAPDISGVSSKPKYLIVGKQVKGFGTAANWVTYYEITAFGYGQSSNTVVILRELYVPI